MQRATKLQELYPSLALSTNYALFSANVLVTLALPSGMSLFSPQNIYSLKQVTSFDNTIKLCRARIGSPQNITLSI